MQPVMQMGLAQNVAPAKPAGLAAKSKEPGEKGFFNLFHTVDTAIPGADTAAPETGADTDPQTLEINMALMMIMRIIQEQAQCVSQDTVQEIAAGDTDAAASPAVLMGNTSVLESLNLLMTQEGIGQSAALTGLQDAIEALKAMRQQAPERAVTPALPEQASVMADAQMAFRDMEPGLVSSLEQPGAVPDLDAVLKKIGVEPDKFLWIKSCLSKYLGTAAIQGNGQETESAPLPRLYSAVNAQSAETASVMPDVRALETAAGQSGSANESVRPIIQHTAIQSSPSAFQGAVIQQTADTQTLSETAGTPGDIFTQLVEKAAAGIQEGKYRMSIQLRPEHLGKVNIKMVMDADGLVVKIHAHNDAVESAISGQLAQLEQTLRDRGVTVVRMEVGQQSLQDNARQSGNPQEGKRQRQGGYYDAGDGDFVDTAGEMFMTLQPYLFNNSVEFHA